MILIGQYDSPFVRRVAIAMRLYGIAFEHRPWSTFGDADKIAPYTPLRRGARPLVGASAAGADAGAGQRGGADRERDDPGSSRRRRRPRQGDDRPARRGAAAAFADLR